MLNKDKQNSEAIPSDLLAALKFAYEPCGLIGSKFTKEAESEEYGAFNFEMNGRTVKFRTAKTTPTKIGQFVTLWKRAGKGPILPFDLLDPIDLFVVSVRSRERFGQFVFPKSVLYEKGILSKEGNGGKRAIRIYPSWDITDNPQAKKTQAWQLLYFFEIDPDNLNRARIQQLFLSL